VHLWWRRLGWWNLQFEIGEVRKGKLSRKIEIEQAICVKIVRSCFLKFCEMLLKCLRPIRCKIDHNLKYDFPMTIPELDLSKTIYNSLIIEIFINILYNKLTCDV